MSRSTIDFGIDLGTTNSAVARVKGTVTEIVKNNRDTDITPSAVFIDKRGSLHVGQTARNRLRDSDKNVHTEFKRQMGTDFRFLFPANGRNMLPEELSADVLKSLRGDVRDRCGEDVEAIVISVPAAFELGQCAATKKAAELAGFRQCHLVQEPVAAALAYGFQQDISKAYWLVYDFGGGTFDAAIMKAEEGNISVLNHGGDNYLGGSDIDWAIVDKLIVPKLLEEFDLDDFERGNRKWESAFARIKWAAENAKIELSRKDSVYLLDCGFKDLNGDDIEVDVELTVRDVATVAEPLVMRSLDICKRTLKDKGLAPESIEKIILVGGPTLAPYFREMVSQGLGVAIDYTVDPLTVVARGAAVFAGTQRLDGKMRAKASAGQYQIDLNYKPVGADVDPRVLGTVLAPEGGATDGHTIEIINRQSRWRSGKITLKHDGKFRLNLLAEPKTQNEFGIELQDGQGTSLETVPSSFTYTMGMVISDQPVTSSLGVALANNDYHILIEKGSSLPARGKHPFRARASVKAGSVEDLLHIPVVEGESPRGDLNHNVGTLTITGKALRRDVPAGSDIEVELRLDVSQQLTVRAYLPILDEELEVRLDLSKKNLSADQLEENLALNNQLFEKIREDAEKVRDATQVDKLDQIADKFEEPEQLVSLARGDARNNGKAHARILELRADLDEIEAALKWPALVAEAREAVNNLCTLANDHGSREQIERAARYRDEVEEVIKARRSDRLQRLLEDVGELSAEIQLAQPGFWVGYFQYLANNTGAMADRERATRLINQGRQFVETGNLQGLQNVVRQLVGLLPEEEAESIRRGYQSGLLK